MWVQTLYLVIRTLQHNIPQNEIKLANYKFSISKETQYLGMILDKKLSWKPFIEQVVARCEKGIHFLRMTMKKPSGVLTRIPYLLFVKLILGPSMNMSVLFTNQQVATEKIELYIKQGFKNLHRSNEIHISWGFASRSSRTTFMS